jgi:MFS family permease
MPSPLLVATSISAAIAVGVVSVLYRGLQVSLHQQIAIADDRLDRLGKTLLFCWLPLMPLAGWLVDHWGVQEVLFAGSLGLGLAMAWLALCRSFVSVLWGVIGLAISGALLTTAGTVLMRDALRLSPDWSTAAPFCLGYVFVGLAALLTPKLIPGLIRRFGYRQTLLCLALLTLVPAALAAFVHADAPVAPQPPPGSPYFDTRYWLVVLVVFLYFSLERALEIWPQPYLADIGYSPRAAFRLTVGFWCAFLLLRFGLGWVIRPDSDAWLVFILLVVSSMIVGNLAGAYARSSGYIGFWLMGVCYGPLFPVLLGILMDLEGPRSLPGQAVGVLFGLTALNSLVVQPVLVTFARLHTPRVFMRIPMLLGLVAAAPVLILALIRFAR